MAAESPPSTGVRALARQLIDQTTELVRMYTVAAQQEVQESLGKLAFIFLLFGLAVACGALGIMTLLLLVASAISEATGVPVWVIALIMLILFIVLAVILAMIGYRRFQALQLVPEQTISTLKEDLEWAQHWTKLEQSSSSSGPASAAPHGDSSRKPAERSTRG